MDAETNGLGSILKGHRTRLGITMTELANRTGLAVSTLSKVESDKMSLTYDKLIQLARGLNVDISELFSSLGARPEPARANARRSINRVSEGAVVNTAHYDHLYLNVDIPAKRFIPIIVECRERSFDAFSDFVRHEGEEFVYVLEGQLEVHTEFYNPTVLSAGESIWMDSEMGHAYVAHGDAPCRALAICSAPEHALDCALRELHQHRESPSRRR
ncbi:MAG TPA: XRE family transcriptional regulator [Sphingobium sp.]